MNSSSIHSIIIVWRTLQSIHERAYNRESKYTQHLIATTLSPKRQMIKSDRNSFSWGRDPKLQLWQSVVLGYLILNLQKCYVWWFINLNLKKKNGNELLGSGGGRPDGVIMLILYDDWSDLFLINRQIDHAQHHSTSCSATANQVQTNKRM